MSCFFFRWSMACVLSYCCCTCVEVLCLSSKRHAHLVNDAVGLLSGARRRWYFLSADILIISSPCPGGRGGGRGQRKDQQQPSSLRFRRTPGTGKQDEWVSLVSSFTSFVRAERFERCRTMPRMYPCQYPRCHERKVSCASPLAKEKFRDGAREVFVVGCCPKIGCTRAHNQWVDAFV